MIKNIEGLDMMEMANNLNEKEVTEALYWMALGDGHLESSTRGNFWLSVSHSPKHEDYLLWKAAIISHITGHTLKLQHMLGGRRLGNYVTNDHDLLRLRARAHPKFSKMRARLYPTGRKMLDPYALSLLGPLGLAILYQDDGSYHYATQAGHNILIHKFCFSRLELEALAKNIVDKFGIIFRINFASNRGFRLRLRAKDRDNFFSLIQPYVVPSMFYKITKGQQLERVGEIV